MKKLFFIIILIILLGIILLGIYFYYLLNKKGRGEPRDFIVRSGQSTREIAGNLESAGIIPSANVFTLYIKLKGELIQVGVYKLSPGQSIKEILAILVSGKTSEYLITIPEGWRLTQIDEALANKKIIKAGQLIQAASADEGYLFPDTYRFLPDAKPEDIRREMLDNFNKKTAQMKITRETIILASIVEREAKFDEDRAKIAGVYLNRLEKNIKLEADPTIQYAKGSWERISLADYKLNSPYNTYLNPGLPPGPIANPGIKSIEAVLHPQKDGFLYFFHKEDGHAVYSRTAEEHAENLKKYQ
ncbi:MAG TPA: endolytic transglycosylase MltG [Patescibacteria group bacterium]|nr:endolytic transglycosylase MltG [Patescibacteria group bacterium]